MPRIYEEALLSDEISQLAWIQSTSRFENSY